MREPTRPPRPPRLGAAFAALLFALALPATPAPPQPEGQEPSVTPSQATEGVPAAATLPGTAPAGEPPADVVVGNRKVATLRGLLFSNPPAERARVAGERIQAAISAGGDLTASIRPEGSARLLQLGGRAMFAITPGDVEEARGETVDHAAGAALARLELAVREAGESRDLAALLVGLGASVLATAFLVLVLAALERLRRWTARKATEKAHERLGAMRIPGSELLEKDRIYWVSTRVILLATRAVDLVAAYVWLAFVLERFAWTRPWGEQLGEWFLRTAAMLGLGALRAVPDLVVVAIIWVATRWLVKALGFLFTAIEEGRIEVSATLRETTQPTRRIVTVVVWVFALIMAYPYLPGSGSEAFKGVGVMVGLMVSLGSSALVGQLASGFMIMYSRSLRVGDFVKAGEVEGTVIQLGLFATRIRTLKREVVTLPNAVLAGQVTRNYSQAQEQGGVVVGTTITIGYDTPWRQVEGLLLLAAERTPGLRRDPAPWVNQRGLGDFYVEYELCAVLDDATQRVPRLTALHASILDAFNEYGVQITSPNYEADPSDAKVVPREQWFAAPSRRRPEGEGTGARTGDPAEAPGGGRRARTSPPGPGAA